MAEGVNLTIDRIRLDIEGNNLEGVGMHIERVALRIVNGHGRIGTDSIARRFPVFTIVARQLILIHRVDIDNITESLTKSLFTIIVDTVAHHRLAPIAQHRTVHQPGLILTCVVVALLGIDGTVA